MARKSHTKSRSGCVECKRRHLKCDEGRPICRNCTFSQRKCSYAPFSKTQDDQETRLGSNIAPATPSAISQVGSTPDIAPIIATYSPRTEPVSLLGVDHIELFHHFTTETCQTIMISPHHTDSYRHIIAERAFQQHFLLAQILALSACHMSLKRPERAAYYHEYASSQQAHAVTGWKDIIDHIDASNCLDVLLFSHLIALQAFWDIFASTQTDLGIFLDQLVRCIRMLRGVNVVIQTWWEALVQTQIGSIMLNADQQQNTPTSSRHECRHLRAMIDDADASAKSMETYHESLDRLQTCFDAENSLDTPGASTHQVFSWLVVASEDYTDLLDQRRPEALVLLAYFAVLLHRRNQSWVINDAGLRLLSRIRSYLGTRWDPLLDQASQMMEQ